VKIRTNLDCPSCGFYEAKVVYEAGGDPPACPECGAARSARAPAGAGHWVDGSARQGTAPSLTGVNPVIDLGDGVLRTSRDAERFATNRALANKSGGWRVELEDPASTRVKMRADERRHAVIEREWAKGVDSKLREVFKEARLGAQAEAAKKALKKNANPHRAAYQATQNTTTLAEAAKGGSL